MSQSVPYSREETVPRFRKIEIYRFVIHDSRREKDILFFPTRLQNVCHRNRSDRVPGIPELSQENNPRWMKKLNSFLFPLSTPLSPSSGKERERRWLKCSMKFIFVVRRKWKKSFDPRCVKFSYADGIFQQYWLNIGTLDDSRVWYICM